MLYCIVCRKLNLGESPATCHHIRHGQGMGQRASHFEAIPLCHEHHQGREGIHTLGTRAWEKRFGTEEELLRQTLEELGIPLELGH